MASNTNPTTNYDSLLLQSLMGRLQLRPPYLSTNSFLSQSLEDFLIDTNSLSDSEDPDNPNNNNSDLDSAQTLLAKEESKLEKDLIRIILSGKIETLKPNSGHAVSVGEHHICVGFHQETDSDYRVWEWHGHLMLFDEENGYTPEYVYGNYMERLLVKPTLNVGAAKKEEEKKVEEIKKEEEKGGNMGLRELIDDGDSITGRILRRHLNAGSPRF